jgi:capsular exopolysaccharide synthesis family protein
MVSNSVPHLITDDAPFEYVEAYKALRTSFNFITANNMNRKIVVTSALRDEGKSSLAINLAISLAQANNKVLLIDADLRNPSLHRYLRIMKDNKLGLSNLLTGSVKVGDCLIQTDFGFDLIAGGPVPPNPAELIGSDAMRDLLNVAAKHYDYIICDAPPVGIITDAAALSPLCDGVLYVIRQNYANKGQIYDAIKKLQTVNAKILGTVMTQHTIPKNARRKYNYRGYSYRYGYEREFDA